MKSYGRAWTKNCASIPESCVFNNALSISYEKEYIYRRSGWRSSHLTRPPIWDKWWVYIWVFKEEKSVCVHKRQARTTTTSAAVATQSCGRSQIAKKAGLFKVYPSSKHNSWLSRAKLFCSAPGERRFPSLEYYQDVPSSDLRCVAPRVNFFFPVQSAPKRLLYNLPSFLRLRINRRFVRIREAERCRMPQRCSWLLIRACLV